MQSINVAFSTADGIISTVIRWFTKSSISHSIITFRDETLDKVFVLEANGRGFMLVPWSKWRQQNKLVARYSLNVPLDQQENSLQSLSEMLGSEYDYVSLVGFLLRRFVKRLDNPFNNPSKLICSEAVARFIEGAKIFGFHDYETWTPEDLFQEIKKNSNFTLEE